MIQNQAGAGLASLGNLCNMAGRPVTSQPRVLRCSNIRWCYSNRSINILNSRKKEKCADLGHAYTLSRGQKMIHWES